MPPTNAQVQPDTVGPEGAASQILVGIPAYNEEVGIGTTILATRKYANTIIVADDGSDDRTAEIARQAGATVLQHQTNQGKGAAIKSLLQYAQTIEFGVLVLLDGDGQHLPRDIPQVAEPVLQDDVDLVIGSRYLDARDDETPVYRRFGQRILDICVQGSTGTNLTDSQSGFRALSPTAVSTLVPTTEGIGVESEMVDIATQHDLTIHEEPIDIRYDGIDGQTYNPVRHGLTVLSFIFRSVRDRHPLLFFSLPGALLTVLGIAYGVDAILVYRQSGTFYPAKALVSGFLTIIGTLGLFVGVMLNRLAEMMDQLSTEFANQLPTSETATHHHDEHDYELEH